MPDVIANWMFGDADDRVRLAGVHKGMGDVSLISQIRAVEDLKTVQLADVTYRVALASIIQSRKSGFSVPRPAA